jgi:hypothetical protein
MASEDADLIRNMSAGDGRVSYRGFDAPAGMTEDQARSWKDSIDASEDERQLRESFMFQAEEGVEGARRYMFGELDDPERERRAQEQFGFEPVRGEPEFVADLRESELRRIGEDPVGSIDRAKTALDKMIERAAGGDAEATRNLADIASLKDPTGASDLLSAFASARLAYDEPERRGSHLTNVAISGAAAAIPLVGSGFVKSIIKGAPDPEVLEDLSDLKGNKPKLNDDGTITFYHRTSPESAAEIRKTGKFLSKESTNEVFLSSKPTGQAEGYGSEVVEVRVDPAKVRLDDAFDDEIHVAIKAADIGKPSIAGPAPVYESAAEQFVSVLPKKLGVASLEGTLGRKKHPKAGQVRKYTQDVKDKNTGEIVHKKGDKKLTKSGEEIVYPEYVYKNISAGEWRDTRLDDFIEKAKAAGKKSVTKDELIKHLNENKVQIEEVRLGESLRKIPKEIDDLSDQKFVAFESLNDEATAAARVLAPGENASGQVDRLLDSPTHFSKLYIDYVGGINRIKAFDDVPDDMQDAVTSVVSLDTFKSISNWEPEDAARITNARNVINAKLADPEYLKMIEQQQADVASKSRSDFGSSRAFREAHKKVKQHDNLTTIARILNEMPEAETRLAALRQFQELPNYKKYAALTYDFNEKYKAFQLESQGLIPRFSNYTVPHGDNYQEILLTVPVPKGFREVDADDMSKVFRDSHHSDIPNVLVHIRTKDRFDHKGRRILFVEEIQSDWHQKGRKRGYRKEFRPLTKDNVEIKRVSPEEHYQSLRSGSEKEMILNFRKERGIDLSDPITMYRLKGEKSFSSKWDPSISDQEILEEINNERRVGRRGQNRNTVPDAPLKDTKEWTALAVKRVFREAADGDYDGVAFSRADMITPAVTMPPDTAFRLIGERDSFLAELEDLRRRGGQYAEGADESEGVFKGNEYYYDKLLPSIARKESKATKDTTFIEFDDQGFVEIHLGMQKPIRDAVLDHLVKNKSVLEVPFFELNKTVKDKVIKPQKLYSVALPGIAIGAAAAEEEELSAVAALGAIGLGGMALYKGVKGSDRFKFGPEGTSPEQIQKYRIEDALQAGSKTEKEVREAAKLWKKEGVESKYFKKWFDDSKIVDSKNEPIRVYHGTDKVFEQFKEPETPGLFGQGIYATFKPLVADDYTSIKPMLKENRANTDLLPNVMPGYASIKNPIFNKDPVDPGLIEEAKRLENFGFRKLYLPKGDQTTLDDLFLALDDASPGLRQYVSAQRKLRLRMEKLGYDGIINASEAEFKREQKTNFLSADINMHLIMLKSSQFKSDIGNMGTFDPTDPRMLYGAGAAVPAAAAVRSQREEEGNPLPDSDGGPFTYTEAVDSGDVFEMVGVMRDAQAKYEDLLSEMNIIEAEYASLSEQQRESKQGKLLEEWYDKTTDEYAEVGDFIDDKAYTRFLMGSDVYFDTEPTDIRGFDERRGFNQVGLTDEPMFMDTVQRRNQENQQRSKLQNTVENGGPYVDFFGELGDLNKYLYKKASFFGEPVQTVQLTGHQKRTLHSDEVNLKRLYDSGLISYLLYRELIGDVELL